VISIAGGVGTLQELCLAYRMLRPTVLLVGFGGWTDRVSSCEWMDERRMTRFTKARTAASAVDEAIRLSRHSRD
jgi:predicted Rossmann-fold nucleotide-binding protein